MKLKTVGIAFGVAVLSTFVCAGPTDEELFRKLSEKAAQGSVAAQYNLGMFYNNGIGTAADPHRAFELFQKAAAAGDPLASYKVGCYYAGQFPGVVETNSEKALAAKLVAAESGYVLAQHDVANTYLSRKNVQEALKWWTKAAEQGDELSLVMLFQSYLSGLGVQQSNPKALELLLITQKILPDDRRAKAQVTVDALKSKVDPAGVAQAEKTAAAWAPRLTELSIRANRGIEEAEQLVR